MKSDGGLPVSGGRISGPGKKLVLLLATAAVLLLAPTAQAFAANVTVEIEGEGSGEVNSTGALFVPEPTPPIACAYTAPGPETGVCDAEMADLGGPKGVALVANPAPGSELTAWIVSGADEGSSFCSEPSENKCVMLSSGGDIAVVAIFSESSSTPKFLLTAATSGTGSGTVKGGSPAEPTTIDCGVTCEHEYAEGEVVTLTPEAAAGSEFVEWTGACSGTGSCEVTMSAAKSVGAVFAASGPASRLTVFVTGEGSVSAASGSISGCTAAGGTACEGQYEGSVTLTGTPSSGWVLAGWLGCRHVAATTCQVTVNEEREVTAVFLKEGTPGAPGSPGQPGKGIVVGTAGPTECPDGGVTVEVEGEPASKQKICDGAAGSPGAPGPQGPQGLTGGAGAQGPAGTAGAKGDIGPAGPQGAAGAQGPAGPKGKVTCKVQGGKKVKVTCIVNYQNGKASGPSPSWRLFHGGKIVRRGNAVRGRVELGQLPSGHYRLHVEGQKGSRLIVVS